MYVQFYNFISASGWRVRLRFVLQTEGTSAMLGSQQRKKSLEKQMKMVRFAFEI